MSELSPDELKKIERALRLLNSSEQAAARRASAKLRLLLNTFPLFPTKTLEETADAVLRRKFEPKDWSDQITVTLIPGDI